MTKLYAEIAKMEAQDDGTVKVWGYASSEMVDLDGETIAPCRCFNKTEQRKCTQRSSLLFSAFITVRQPPHFDSAEIDPERQTATIKQPVRLILRLGIFLPVRRQFGYLRYFRYRVVIKNHADPHILGKGNATTEKAAKG